MPEHVCGLQGYDGMRDPPCPACERPKPLVALISELAELARADHYFCEDQYYSCPAHPEGCWDSQYGNTKECNCGADEHNRKVDELLAKIKLGELP